MAYRKFIADQLFTGREMLGKDAVLITDEKGTIVEITNREAAGDGIEQFNGIISPGFINCHCHLELSHMKGQIPPEIGMVQFLLTVMRQRNVPEEEILVAIKNAEQYMIERGIVAVGDTCNTPHTIVTKKEGNLYYHNFIEVAGFINSAAASRFKQAKEIYADFIGQVPPDKTMGNTSFVPHAPYSVSDELFQLINSFDANSLLSIHNQESEAESEFFATGKGGFAELFQFLKTDIHHFSGSRHTSLLHCLHQFSKSHSLILVHNVHTSIDDLEWIGRNKNELPSLFWCLCPNANLYINDKLPDVPLLQKYHCKMVVGTDSLASNFALNVLEELKTLQKNFNQLSTSQLLQWATANGAEALRIDNFYGTLEKGKRPGLVHIDGGRSGMLEGTVAKKIL